MVEGYDEEFQRGEEEEKLKSNFQEIANWTCRTVYFHNPVWIKNWMARFHSP